MSTILKDKTTRIKKSRRCSWCGEMLHVGEIAKAVVGVNEYGFFSSILHLECNSVSHEIYEHEYCEFGQCRGCICAKGNCECRTRLDS